MSTESQRSNDTFSRELLQSVSRKKDEISTETVQTDQLTSKIYLLPEDRKIKDKRVIQLYGENVKKFCEENHYSQKAIADHCEVTPQAISDIIKGKNQSINIKICNRLSVLFKCSAYHLLGLAKERYGILVNAEEVKIPFLNYTLEEDLGILQASHWLKTDPELFGLLVQAFELDSDKRKMICEVIKTTIIAAKKR